MLDKAYVRIAVSERFQETSALNVSLDLVFQGISSIDNSLTDDLLLAELALGSFRHSDHTIPIRCDGRGAVCHD